MEELFGLINLGIGIIKDTKMARDKTYILGHCYKCFVI